MRAYLFSLHPCGRWQSRPRRAGLICIAIFIAVFGLSCRSKTADKTGEDGSEPNVSAETEANDIAVTVNGVDIAESKIERLIKPQLERMAERAAQLPPALAEQYREQLRREILEQLIRDQLLEEKIEEANIVVTEEEVISKITEIATVQRPPLSLEDFKKKIEEYGLTFDDVKEDVRRGLSRDRFMASQWADKINVTEDDAKKYYDENPKWFETPEQVRASHILIKPVFADPGTDPNEAKCRPEQRLKSCSNKSTKELILPNWPRLIRPVPRPRKAAIWDFSQEVKRHRLLRKWLSNWRSGRSAMLWKRNTDTT